MSTIGNLEQRFIQTGLKGVVSDYIKNPSDEALDYITKKIRSSMTLYILWYDNIDLPYLEVVKGQGFVASVFSDYNVANGYLQKKQSEGYEVTLQEVVGGKKRMECFAYIQESGATTILIDLSLYQSLRSYLPARQMDGFTEKTPLKNQTLNAVLSYYIQQGSVDQLTEATEKKMFQLMQTCHFYMPVIIDADIATRGDGDATNCDYPVFQDDEELNFMKCFTDDNQFVANLGTSPYVAVAFDFMSMFKMLQDYRLEYILLNNETHCMFLDKKTFLDIMNKYPPQS